MRVEEEHNQAFEALKEAVSKADILKAPRPGGESVLYTDASGVGIEAALWQKQDGQEVPIEFASRRLTDVERRWDTREREL